MCVCIYIYIRKIKDALARPLPSLLLPPPLGQVAQKLVAMREHEIKKKKKKKEEEEEECI